MLRYCALSRSLVKIRLQDTSLAHFSKTLRSLCLILSWKAVVKSKNKFNNNLRQGLLFLYVYFLFSIFHSNRPKSMAKRAGCSKNPLFFALKISFIQWGINETITRLSWKFEKNRTSGRFYFFKQKKEHRKWNPLYSTGRHLFFCNKKHFFTNLSAILIDFRTETAVIFGFLSLHFFFVWKLLENMKMTPLLCACAVVITLETQKCRKGAPRSVEFNFFINCNRQKRFSQNERRRADLHVQNVASDFLIFAWGLSYIMTFQILVMILPRFFDFEKP